MRCGWDVEVKVDGVCMGIGLHVDVDVVVDGM